MGVSLSIKNVPDALAEALRRRAVSNHRSLQRELMAIVEAATSGTGSGVGGSAGVGANATAVTPAPTVREGDGRYAVAAMPPGGADDGLLSELDAIVGGSRWGGAPLLTREQAHDRELTRVLDLDARAEELAQARQRARRSAST